MPPSATDRNLLTGVIALQMEFISRDQFVAAIAAWVSDKERSLESVLIEQKALDESDATLLHGMVHLHFTSTEGDPKSITMPETVDQIHDELTSIGDADLDIFLHLLRQRGVFDDPGVPDPNAPPDGGRFEIKEKVAEGGLGVVSRARDRQLNRDVALKEIQPQHADNVHSRLRFTLEAEVTGGLEHPGIVPVYALGVDRHGRPFYAMRLVRGESLLTVIRKIHDRSTRIAWKGMNLSTLRRLLSRLVDVCNTIAYAHSRGVIHRDVKPGNIMLGKFGETLLVDWGLAKALSNSPGDDASRWVTKIHDIEVADTLTEPDLQPLGTGVASFETRAGDRMGTPSYMSPEQALGRVDQVGPATDVYGLGATLYELLSGKAPHAVDDEPGELHVPLRRINRSVPPALAAICEKAMAAAPQDRYAAASLMASDLEAWMADDAITALDEPVWEKARRWMRKRQSLMAGITATALVSALSLGMLAAYANSTNRQLQAAADRERIASEQARASEIIAQQQSELALDALNAIVFQVQERLKRVPAAQPARRELLRTAIDGLNRLAGQFVDGENVGRNQSRALVELSGILLTVGDDESLGTSVQAAHDAAIRAVSVADACVAQNSHDLLAMRELFTALEQLCQVNERLGNTEELAEVCQRMGTLVSGIDDASQHSRESRELLAATHLRLGNLKLRTGSTIEAVSELDRTISILTRLVATSDSVDVPASGVDNPSSKGTNETSRLNRKLANAYDDRGMALDQLGQRDAAVESVERALALVDLLLLDEPEHILDIRSRSVYLSNLGVIHLNQNHVEQAVPHLDESLRVRQAQLELDPSNEQLIQDVSVIHDRLAKACASLQQTDKAREHYEQSVALAQRLAEGDSENLSTQFALAKGLTNLAGIYFTNREYAQALESHLRAHSIDLQIAAKDPLNIAAQKDLAICLLNIGMTHVKLDRRDLAAEAYEKSIKSNLKVLALDPGNRYALTSTAWGYRELADVYREMDNEQLCVRTFQDGIAFAERVLDSDPSDKEALGNHFQLQAELALFQGDIERASALAGEFAKSDPDNADNLYNAACIYGLAIRELASEDGSNRTALSELERLAITALKNSVAAGYVEFDNMRHDDDLLPLRDLPEFRALLPTD